jgi:hypothetical protein
MKLMRNTTAVLVLTLFTGLAVFTAIQLGGRLFGTPTASARTLTTQSATGQSGNGSGNGYGQSSGGSTQSDPNGYGSSSGSGSSSGGQTYTCPATGCTASSCHATQ